MCYRWLDCFEISLLAKVRDCAGLAQCAWPKAGEKGGIFQCGQAASCPVNSPHLQRNSHTQTSPRLRWEQKIEIAWDSFIQREAVEKSEQIGLQTDSFCFCSYVVVSAVWLRSTDVAACRLSKAQRPAHLWILCWGMSRGFVIERWSQGWSHFFFGDMTKID